MATPKHTLSTIVAAVKECPTLAAAAVLLGMNASYLRTIVREKAPELAATKKTGRPRKVQPQAVLDDYIQHGNAAETGRRLGVTAECVRVVIRDHAPHLFTERASIRTNAKTPAPKKDYPPEKRPFAADPELASRAGTISAERRAA